MACASCNNNTKGDHGYIEPKAREIPPFGAEDIQVYDPTNSEVRRYTTEDFPSDRHKLFLFFPETFTPVCQSEMGSLNNWISEFEKLNCIVYAITTDPIHVVKDWYEQEESLKDSRYKILSSYMLTTRLKLSYGSRAKRASVFMMSDGDVIVQEHFLKVGRSIKELHRTLYGYSQDSYCAEGWENPEDGFLDEINKEG